MSTWKELNLEIQRCRRCPRLIEHCQQIATVKRKAFRDEEYWGRPVPNLGAMRLSLLIVGLAPAAHGANRTGRMFTGDRSGDWLFRALHKAGFCNQSVSQNTHDGLKLKRCAITAICHCAPPDNKPNRQEIDNCAPFLEQTLELSRPPVVLALGGLAWNSMTRYAQQRNWIDSPRPKFGHAVNVELHSAGQKKRWLVGCYHPSQQNTFTGRLTESMLDQLFSNVNKLIGHQ